MTTPPFMSVTDELIAELERSVRTVWPDEDAAVLSLEALLSERAELKRQVDELRGVIKDVRWRVADTTDQLQAYHHNGDRLYGLDEWSVPIRNLNITIGILEKHEESEKC